MDVADNWIGGCCTSFGGASEKLVSNYINAYGRLEGTSLLDATSISIETDYLEDDLLAQVPGLTLSHDSVAQEEAIADVSIRKDHTAGKIELDNSEQQADITRIHSKINGVTRQAGHGKFSFRHPWGQYQKLGALCRQCASSMEALASYVVTLTKSQVVNYRLSH